MSMTVSRKHVNILNGFNKVKQQTGDTSEGNMKHLKLGKNSMPASKEDILQDKIFNSQLEQYVNTEDCKVAVLNAFPYIDSSLFPHSFPLNIPNSA